MPKIVAVGECMIEMARRDDGAFDLQVGGDTFNTAIYLARLGASVAYMTALGDDPYSALILGTANAENVNTDPVCIVPGRTPGLYLIETSEGERSFWYWRDRSPARDLFELPDADWLVDQLAGADTVYLSGITLSLYSDIGLDRLEDALRQGKANGAQVIIDSNYRPVGWQRDIARARSVYARFWPYADIALPSFDDEQSLWGDTQPNDTFARLEQFGVAEICLKMADEGAIVHTGGSAQLVTPEAPLVPVDTTAAGDSFSAAYLWARLNGRSARLAAEAGNRLAGIVVQHRGAIAPIEATAACVEAQAPD